MLWKNRRERANIFLLITWQYFSIFRCGYILFRCVYTFTTKKVEKETVDQFYKSKKKTIKFQFEEICIEFQIYWVSLGTWFRRASKSQQIIFSEKLFINSIRVEKLVFTKCYAHSKRNVCMVFLNRVTPRVFYRQLFSFIKVTISSHHKGFKIIDKCFKYYQHWFLMHFANWNSSIHLKMIFWVRVKYVNRLSFEFATLSCSESLLKKERFQAIKSIDYIR